MSRIAMAIAAGLAAATGIVSLAGAQTAALSASAPANPYVRGPQDGAGLFLARCGYCHLEGGTGTMMLERRLGKANRLLAERTDLPADYVKAVARNGINSMPTITRVEVTDEELDKIAAYLATAKKKKAATK